MFLRYQCYYEYPLLTYLEYPIVIAQGNRALPARRGPGPPLPPSHSEPFPPDVILLLHVFHFNGNVFASAPYVALYPSTAQNRRWAGAVPRVLTAPVAQRGPLPHTCSFQLN